MEAFILLVVVYKAFDWLVRCFYIGKYSERYILVTGCDTGFGNLLAKRLDALGCHVFAGCLTEMGETDLQKACSNKLLAVSLDVSKPNSVSNAYEIVKAKLPQGKGLWAVMNNAGVAGATGPPEWLTTDDYKRVAAVNLYGLIDVTMTFLPLVKKERGRVVNTSSCAARIALPVIMPYCVAKYGVEAFSDGLRRSLYAFNVKVSLIEPGAYATNITSKKMISELVSKSWNQASDEIKEEYGDAYYKFCKTKLLISFKKMGSTRLDDVVDAYQHAILGRFPRARYVVGKDGKYIFLPMQSLPEWMSDWLLFKMNRDQPLPAALGCDVRKIH
jgi:NAD(P)-dependent dehydrogenase (short-subunit alcohol dehydrogenase family)